MDIKLNAEQEAAVKMAVAAAGQPGTVSILEGSAGTGKTTTLKAVLEALQGETRIVAPTGRAALRAAELTGGVATTIHSWLYKPILDAKGKLVRFDRRALEEIPRPSSGLLVVDEASMLNRRIWEDIRSTAKKLSLSVLLVGDGFQLPPVADRNEEPFSVFAPSFQPDKRVTLTEVWRQALDSPVLRCANEIRKASWGEVKSIVTRYLPNLARPVSHEAADFVRHKIDGIVIAHKNDTRRAWNRATRVELGLSEDIETGEPLLIKRNEWDVGVCNGEITPFQGWEGKVRNYEETYGRTKLNGITVAMIPEAIREERQEPLFKNQKSLKNQFGIPYIHAFLGYVVTCHASQGSEWNEVVIVVENSLYVMPEEERLRWLYTAITRAKKRVVVARQGSK